MKTENRCPRIGNSALITKDSALSRGGAMKNNSCVLLIIVVLDWGGFAQAQQAKVADFG